MTKSSTRWPRIVNPQTRLAFPLFLVCTIAMGSACHGKTSGSGGSTSSTGSTSASSTSTGSSAVSDGCMKYCNKLAALLQTAGCGGPGDASACLNACVSAVPDKCSSQIADYGTCIDTMETASDCVCPNAYCQFKQCISQGNALHTCEGTTASSSSATSSSGTGG